MMTATVDLRSDTVTKPTAAMRAAMANAEVGDDVYGEDPTVNRLQQTVAELLGTEAALFVPSGTMANQIAVGVLTRPGDEVIVGANAHNWLFETGGAAAINGVQHCVVAGDGRFEASDVIANTKPNNHHYSPTTVVAIENTHNMGGGRVWPLASMKAVISAAKAAGLRTHLDGARLWNAAAATGATLSELCSGFDTVAVCLSKGLGAPVGSLVCGTADSIDDAHRRRKMLGGGMRQAGILAAAGLYALDHHVGRLVDDHRRAKQLADALAELEVGSVGPVDTNIVIWRLEDGNRAEETCQRAAADGILFSAFGNGMIRFVTHLDIDDAGLSRAIDAIRTIVGDWR